MAKFLTLVLMALFARTFLLAQDSEKKVRFGVKTGVNVTHFNLKDVNDEKINYLESKWKSGFVFGAFVKIPLHKSLCVQPEFLYSAMGGDYIDDQANKTKTRYNYFSMPVLFKFFFGNHWAIIAGPQFDFLIQGKELMNGQKFDVSHELKDHDILATGGFDYWPCKSIVLSARYMKGFTDIDFRSNGIRYYQEGMQASIGLKF